MPHLKNLIWQPHCGYCLLFRDDREAQNALSTEPVVVWIQHLKEHLLHGVSVPVMSWCKYTTIGWMMGKWLVHQGCHVPGLSFNIFPCDRIRQRLWQSLLKNWKLPILGQVRRHLKFARYHHFDSNCGTLSLRMIFRLKPLPAEILNMLWKDWQRTENVQLVRLRVETF